MGFPVVIAANGLGVPVVNVGDGNAPLMTVAENGLGMPIVLVESGRGVPARVAGAVPSWVPDYADLYADFQNNRYYEGSVKPLSANVTDTHATDILALGSGGYQTFGPDVLPRTDLGLLTTVGRTNHIRGTGLSGAVVGAVGSGGALPSGWFSNFDTTEVLEIGQRNGLPIIKIAVTRDNSGSGSATYPRLQFVGANAVPYIQGVVWTGSAYVAELDSTHSSALLLDATDGSGSVGSINSGSIASGFERAIRTGPSSSGSATHIRLQMGTTVPSGEVYAAIYEISAPQLEEGPFATDPIITEGSAVTRPGNRPVIDLTGRLGEGVAGVIAVDILQPPDGTFGRVLSFNDGTDSNEIRIAQRGSDGKLAMYLRSGGVTIEQTGVGDWRAGRQLIAFAISDSFCAIQRVGDNLGIFSNPYMPSGLFQAGLGSLGFTSPSNTYQRTERLALKFGPQNQASFDTMYALAQEWAAE